MWFRRQLILGIGALTAVMMFCVMMAIATLVESSRETSDVTSELMTQLGHSRRIGVRSERLVATARGYLLTGSPHERQVVLDVSDDLAQALSEVTTENRNPIRATSLVAVRLAADRYVSEVLQAGASAFADDGPFPPELRDARLRLHRAVRAVMDSEIAGAQELVRHSGERVGFAGTILVIGCGLGTAIGISLAVLVSRRLFGEYTRGQHVARVASEAARARKELLDMASHDLRSPLHTIVLCVDLLTEQHGSLAQATTIRHATERMQKLIEGLLDASEAETTGLVLGYEQTTLAALLEATRELFAARAGRAGVRLQLGQPPVEPIVVDGERVLQILSNLVSNALSFTPRGGEVTLDATIRHGSIRVAVSDTGPGIPEPERARLFESFYQGGEGRDHKRSRRGSVGLGLYIARSLVVAHGGRIGVDSSVGQGSTFWFEIPAQPGPHTRA